MSSRLFGLMAIVGGVVATVVILVSKEPMAQLVLSLAWESIKK